MSHVAAKIFLAMEVNIEANEIEKIEIEVFGGRIVRIGKNALWIGLLADVAKLGEEFTDYARPVPSRDIRSDLVAEAVRENRIAILFQFIDTALNRLANVVGHFAVV